ncbi:hypothetical protein BC833DRAFT_592575 [Globomyces pollinis-pini]|nr:hypothetical protein BC833DRAFT_592575 [Globomyces pollinis-pini]
MNESKKQSLAERLEGSFNFNYGNDKKQTSNHSNKKSQPIEERIDQIKNGIRYYNETLKNANEMKGKQTKEQLISIESNESSDTVLISRSVVTSLKKHMEDLNASNKHHVLHSYKLQKSLEEIQLKEKQSSKILKEKTEQYEQKIESLNNLIGQSKVKYVQQNVETSKMYKDKIRELELNYYKERLKNQELEERMSLLQQKLIDNEQQMSIILTQQVDNMKIMKELQDEKQLENKKLQNLVGMLTGKNVIVNELLSHTRQ